MQSISDDYVKLVKAVCFLNFSYNCLRKGVPTKSENFAAPRQEVFYQCCLLSFLRKLYIPVSMALRLLWSCQFRFFRAFKIKSKWQASFPSLFANLTLIRPHLMLNSSRRPTSSHWFTHICEFRPSCIPTGIVKKRWDLGCVELSLQAEAARTWDRATQSVSFWQCVCGKTDEKLVLNIT